MLLSLRPYVTVTLTTTYLPTYPPRQLLKLTSLHRTDFSAVIGKNQARLENPADKDPGCCNAWCVGYCALEMTGHWGFM